MLDKSIIGHQFTPFTCEVDKDHIQLFTQAIGETNPIYTDETAAQAAGYRTIPAPPTYMLAIDADGPDFLPQVEILGMDLTRLLHVSQDFHYFGQIYAGDQITQQCKIADIFDKKHGALEFVVLESNYKNQQGILLGKAQLTLAYRH